MNTSPKKKEHGSEQKEDKGKINEALENIKKNENIESLVKYAQNNIQDTIALALMIVGLLWFLIHGFYGGILIGLVAGFYFSRELIYIVKSYYSLIEEHGPAKSLIFAGAALALIISAPGIFIGAAIMVGLKVMLKAE